ncbi:hypothetical protein HMPREF0063_10086 [Aeromicrobium marinum DSM 15272]|uniref:Uncharacterized protein n=1 Tax=Aeromicrobium marinum DSM 15272 TaxID=585531 RepID=E2S7S9_9ACTN|nr:hypothetical protein [Aeromicrobium marinum]EFQ84745.1 hypothetical protein HMPREF0063_10086 [Aeromicrobium marinum DSM 15272]
MATAKKTETPADETAEPKPRTPQVAPPTHIAYLAIDGRLVDIAAFGTRKADREDSKDYALENGWKVATIPAGVTVRTHLDLTS